MKRRTEQDVLVADMRHARQSVRAVYRDGAQITRIHYASASTMPSALYANFDYALR